MLTKTLFTPVLFGATAFPAALAARNGPRNSGLTVVDRNNEHLQPLDARELSRNPASPLTPQTAELRPVDGFQHESPVESPSASQLDSQSTATDLARDSKDSPQNADQRPGYTRTHSRSFPKMSKRSPEPRGHHRSNTQGRFCGGQGSSSCCCPRPAASGASWRSSTTSQGERRSKGRFYLGKGCTNRHEDLWLLVRERS